MISTVFDDLKDAQAWHSRPLPEPSKLRSVTEFLAELKASIRQEIRFRDQERFPADLLEQRIYQAAEDIEGDALAGLGQGRLVAYLDTSQGLERLPNGAYWVHADGSATALARRALVEGIAASNRHAGLVGTVKFSAGDFDVFADAYRAESGHGGTNPGAGRFEHPVWDLRDVFGWVLDRDQTRFGRINSESDWRSAAWAARFYAEMPGRREFDRLADQTLLHALQRGELTGYRGSSAIPREFWIDKTELTLRHCAANFYCEEVLALWPDPRTLKSRLPPPITPLRGRCAAAVLDCKPPMDRSPPWTIWNNIPELRVFEAVALSLNIDPRKLRRSPHGWMAGKRLFDEDEEFNERLFVAERNLTQIGVVDSARAHYEGHEPIVRLDSFLAWARRIGWALPAELLDTSAVHDSAPSPADHAKHSPAASRDSTPAKPLLHGRSGRKKGSGRADDTEHLRAMLHLLASREATSVYAAAGKVADTITGSSQSRAADITRLRRKFARQHGTEPPEGKSWIDIESELDSN